MSIDWSTAVLMGALAGAALSCHSGPSQAVPDAAPAVAAPARIVHPRVAAPGEIPLDVAKSRIAFSVIKDRETATPVLVNVTARDGAVSLDASPPSARVTIDLDTIESGIPLRNERIRGIFFETSAIGWETAELVVPSIPADVVAALKTKHSASHVSLDATLKIHGRTAPLPLVVNATYTTDGQLSVSSVEPISVKVSGFGLTDNLRRLSQICMHDSIDDLVKVTASFQFSSK